MTRREKGARERREGEMEGEICARGQERERERGLKRRKRERQREIGRRRRQRERGTRKPPSLSIESDRITIDHT